MRNDITHWIRFSNEDYQGVWWGQTILGKIKHKELLTKEGKNLLLSIDLNLNLLKFVITKNEIMRTAICEKISKINQKSHICTTTYEGYALDIDAQLEKDMLCNFILYVSLTIAVCERIKKIIEKIVADKKLELSATTIIAENDIEYQKSNQNWYLEFSRLRNNFMHDSTPEMAFDITKKDIFFWVKNNTELTIYAGELKQFNLCFENYLVTIGNKIIELVNM